MPSWWPTSRGKGNKLTPEYLAGLCLTVERYSENAVNVKQDVIIETVRQLAEVLVWGDSQDEIKIFDTFLERNMLPYLTGLLRRNVPIEVKVQLVQTLYIIIQNLKNPMSVFYLLSGNHINNLILDKGLGLEEDEELLSTFINFLKSLSLRLDEGTIQCFYNRDTDTFPLYEAAEGFLSHPEALVRTASRAIVVHMCKVDDPYVVNYVVSTAGYLDKVFEIFVEQTLRLHRHAEAFQAAVNFSTDPSVYPPAPQPPSLVYLAGLVDDITDDLFYFGDLLQLKSPLLLYSLYTATTTFSSSLYTSIRKQGPLPPYIAHLVATLWLLSTPDPTYLNYVTARIAGHAPKFHFKKPPPLPPVQQKHFEVDDAAQGSEATTPAEASVVPSEGKEACDEVAIDEPQEAEIDVLNDTKQSEANPEQEEWHTDPVEEDTAPEEVPTAEVAKDEEVEAEAEEVEARAEAEVEVVATEEPVEKVEEAAESSVPQPEQEEPEKEAPEPAEQEEIVEEPKPAEEEKEEEVEPLPSTNGEWLLNSLEWCTADGMRDNVTGINLLYGLLETRLSEELRRAVGVAQPEGGAEKAFQGAQRTVELFEGALNEIPEFLTVETEVKAQPGCEGNDAECGYPFLLVGAVLKWLCSAVRDVGTCGRVETYEVAVRCVEVMVKGKGLAPEHEAVLNDVYRCAFGLVRRRLGVIQKENETATAELKPAPNPPPSLMGGSGAPTRSRAASSMQPTVPVMVFDPLEALYFQMARVWGVAREVAGLRPKQILQRPSSLLPLQPAKAVEVQEPGSPGSVTESAPCSPGPAKSAEPGTYRVIGKSGAMVRQEESLESKLLVRLKQSCVVEIVEVRQRRCRIATPVAGWISMWNSVGETILQRVVPEEPERENGLPLHLVKIPLEQRNPATDEETATVECAIYLQIRRLVDTLAARPPTAHDIFTVTESGNYHPKMGTTVEKDSFASHVRCQLCPQPTAGKPNPYATAEFSNTHIGTVLFACLEETELVLLQDLPPHMQQPSMACIVAVCPLVHTLVHVDVRLNYRMSLTCKDFRCTLTFENAATCQQTASKVNATAKQFRAVRTRGMCNFLNDPCLEI